MNGLKQLILRIFSLVGISNPEEARKRREANGANWRDKLPQDQNK